MFIIFEIELIWLNQRLAKTRYVYAKYPKLHILININISYSLQLWANMHQNICSYYFRCKSIQKSNIFFLDIKSMEYHI